MRILLLVVALSSCCSSVDCPPPLMWMLGTPLENGNYVITACLDDDCDEATFTIDDGGASSPTGSRITATSTQVTLRTERTEGIRARLNITRDGALVLSDLRSVTWMKTTNTGACNGSCPLAVVPLQ